MLVESVDDVVGGIVGIFETPWLGGVFGAFWNFMLVFLLWVGSFVVSWRMTVRGSSHDSYHNSAQKNLS